MTLNKDQAEYEREQIYDDAVQSEIHAILASDGYQFVCHVAQKIGKPLEETRWHLTQMRNRGDVNYKMGAYGL